MSAWNKRKRQRPRRQPTSKRPRTVRLTTNRSSRRGVLLLVVLSMLTLFLMIGTAYIVTANQFRRANKTYARAAQSAHTPAKQQVLVNEVFNQILRDTNNQFSALRYHSLLRDVYGNDGFTAQLAGCTFDNGATILAGSTTNGQILELNLSAVGVTDLFGNRSPITNLSAIDNAYNGLVLTFLDGKARGQSTRIIGYIGAKSTGPKYVFRVMGFQLADGQTITDPSVLDGSRILVNGRPFNGTGVGYDQSPTGDARLTAAETINGTDLPLALMPNAVSMNPENILNVDYLTQYEIDNFRPEELVLLKSKRGLPGLGGSDESYDAVDFQNMFLAMLPLNPGEFANPSDRVLVNSGLDGVLGTPDDRPLILPSFHRPALLNYWNANIPTFESDPTLLRKVLMRPSWLDHPKFSGSNPNLTQSLSNLNAALAGNNASGIETSSDELLALAIYGPWDVDNDNDGIRDSIWVDFGAPLMEGPNGRLVKPMAAVLVLDMEGRLNLNAHGTKEMVDINPVPTGQRLASPNPSTKINWTNDIPVEEGGQLPRGEGYGPADINLGAVLSNLVADGENNLYGIGSSNESEIFRRLLGVSTNTNYLRKGRYGWEAISGSDPTKQGNLLTQIKDPSFPQNARGRLANSDVLGEYATPPNLSARYVVGLNDFGQPVYDSYRVENNGNTTTDPLFFDINSPYLSNLSMQSSRGESSTTIDSMFSVAELERLLRAYDSDAGSQPSRLWDIANDFIHSSSSSSVDLEEFNEWRTLLTTDSFDMPVPNSILPEWVQNGADGTPGNADDFERVMGRPPVGATFATLLEYRLRVGFGFLDPVAYKASPANIERIRREMAKLLPQDLADGLRLDINRPFGNGRDDNNNGVVDEPGELDGVVYGESNRRDIEASRWANNNQVPVSFSSPTTGRYRDDVNRDGMRDADGNGEDDLDGGNDILAWERGDTNNDGEISFEERVALHNYRRQLLAKDLYVLAMAVVDPPPLGMSAANKRKRARRLAQWAINIVDFRDPDNCMTPFEFDYDPFDGWRANGNLNDNADLIGDDGQVATNDDTGGVVWGTERPELLISETLAWHDRRTTDENIESTNSVNNGEFPPAAFVTAPATDTPDTDYDQKFRPRGAAFIELYNPYPANPAVNTDTHVLGGQAKLNNFQPARGEGGYDGIEERDPNNQDMGVHVGAVDQATGTTPVWRIAVFQRPFDPLPSNVVDLEDANPSPLPNNRFVEPFNCASWDPDAPEPDELPATLMDRCIYLAPMLPGNIGLSASSLQAINDNEGTGTQVVEYYSNLPVPTVRPGRFLVIGSGEEQDGAGNKQPGSGIFASEIGDVDPSMGISKPRRIELRTFDATSDDPDRSPVKFVEPSNMAPLLGNEIAFKDLNAPSSPPICSAAIITHAVINGTPYKRRFTFTEPAGGYPGDPGVPTTGPSYFDDPTKEGYYGNAAQEAAYDRPHDDVRRDELFMRQGGTPYDDRRLQLPVSNTAQRLLECYSMVYLQRLANPLLPFHKNTNPYRTIDAMSTNVTVFNGTLGDPSNPGEKRRPDPTIPPTVWSNEYAVDYFASVQRGYSMAHILEPASRAFGTQANTDRILKSLDPHGSLRFNIFGYEPPSGKIIGDSNADLAPYGMQVAPKSSYVNQFVPTGHSINVIPDFTLGSLNHAFMSKKQHDALFSRDATNIANELDGLTPAKPFPWLTWNNRPYISSNELLVVPTSRSSRLLQEFSGAENTTYPFVDADPTKPAVSPVDSYNTTKLPNKATRSNNPSVRSTPAYLPTKLQGSFGHLPNMYISKNPSAQQLPDVVAGLFRVLDYIHVPSRFVGTETWLNPTHFGQEIASSSDARFSRQPPFNKISSYREPGRVNLNTIVDRRVWEGGIMHRSLRSPGLRWNPITNYYDFTTGHAGPTFDQTVLTADIGYISGYSGTDNILGNVALGDLVSSRRGYASPILDEEAIGFRIPLVLSDASPTFFRNPFRASDARALVPLNDMVNSGGAHCTLLRQDSLSTADPKYSLFRGVTTNDLRTNDPIVENAYRDSYKNPYFYNQPLIRLDNLTTTRSNVFAIWITIGFFEVEDFDENIPEHVTILKRYGTGGGTMLDARGDPLFQKVYPDGYLLGQEAGSETGDIQRVREFAIVDRTIPVAFEPGKNHNVERAVRLRRRIE